MIRGYSIRVGRGWLNTRRVVAAVKAGFFDISSEVGRGFQSVTSSRCGGDVIVRC
jgi:hypothetical protein